MTAFSLDTARIGIVGAGRLGTALGTALRRSGRQVEGPFSRGADGAGCDVVLLCVPDVEIASAARCIVPGSIVGHTSGATPLAPLEPHERFSMHPLLSVSHDATVFSGAGCAIDGSTERALGAANALASVLGMLPFRVEETDRPLYHAAASMASNYLVTLEAAAERLFAAVGVSREYIAPLVRSAMDQWARVGPRDALTGPVVRGDEPTVVRQRDAIATRAPETLPLWDALTEATRALARSPKGDSR